MNDTHQNACLARHGREQIVARIISGQTAGVVAAAVAVSIRTLRKWMARFRTGGLAQATDMDPIRANPPNEWNRRCCVTHV